MPSSARSLTSLTPPKWIAAQQKMDLEDRLEHFISWLAVRGIPVWLTSDTESGKPLRPNEIEDLIQEYVNT